MDEATQQQPEDATVTETRLMISRVVNENFKSYAGKQELGPFHKVSFTSNPQDTCIHSIFIGHVFYSKPCLCSC